MAGGARMASQGPLGLLEAKGTREKPAALEHQVKIFSFSSFRGHRRPETVYEIPGLSGGFPNRSY